MSGTTRPAGIVPRTDRAARLPLSALQEQIWFLDRLAPGRSSYNVVRAFRLEGELDLPALEAALAGVIARHEALRVVFGAEDGRPYQEVLDTVPTPLRVLDLSDLDAEERERAGLDAIEAEAHAAFDLERGPVLRCLVVRLAERTHLLEVTMHHICTDGASIPLFWSEVSELYSARRAGAAPDLPELAVQYGDFALWQRARLEEPAFERRLSQWVERLQGLEELALPTDRPRPSDPAQRSATERRMLGPEVLRALKQSSDEARATLLMSLTAAFQAVLARQTGQDEIVLGTTVAGRPRRELAPLIGPFINMIVLRTDVSGDPTFAELRERTKQTYLDAWPRRDVPFDRVVSAVRPSRDTSKNPLFQVGIQLLEAATTTPRPDLDGIEATPIPIAPGHPFDLSISASETPDGLRLIAEFSTDLFDHARVVRLLGQLERVIAAVCADPGLRVSELPLLDEAERERLLVGWQGPAVEQPRVPVHVQVAEVAAREPGLVAARADGAELSYGELDRRAGLVARRLRAAGVASGEVVAVALGRGPELLVALLGVLKAGAAFVVVDASHPARRLEFILRDTAARVVLTDGASAGRLPAVDGVAAVRLDEEREALEALASEPLEEWADEGSLAYVLYTSGSTGTPKGVLVEHHALTTFLVWLGGYMGPGDRVAQHMALIFDFAVGEIFTALSRGATLVFVPEGDRLVPEAIGALLERERITYLAGPPAILGAIPRGEYPSIRAMVVGGEAFGGELVNRWNVPGRRFVNGYGPTEAAVGCIFYECEHRFWDAPPPIGRAMPRRVAYVLDRFDQLCPVGVPGEVVVGGAGLARGYLNLPELTAERFVPDPFRPGERIYRTGDLGVWTEDGQIQFLGRIDTQVKLNGLRIELEEIESALLAHPAVEAAAAAVCEPRPGLKQLVGYVVTGGEAVADEALREHLADSLPRYMIPTAFVTLDALPLTPVGKIDRKALPAPEADSGPAEHVAPRTETEQAVARVFAEILGRDSLGVEDNFFTLGGTSLQAARAVVALRDATGAELPLGRFYAAPRVADVAEALDAIAAEAGGEEDEEALLDEIEALERELAQARSGQSTANGDGS